MEEPVADGVRERGVGEVVVPLRRRELTRNDGGARAGAIFEEFEEVAAILIAERAEAPVVDLCGAPHNSSHVKHLVM